MDLQQLGSYKEEPENETLVVYRPVQWNASGLKSSEVSEREHKRAAVSTRRTLETLKSNPSSDLFGFRCLLATDSIPVSVSFSDPEL